MKKFLCFILVFAIVFSLSGCDGNLGTLGNLLGIFDVIAEEEKNHIAFSNGTIFDESKEVFYYAEDFSENKGAYANLRSDIYYSALDENEKMVYNALIFALENSYCNILVDKKLVSDSNRLFEILIFVALDSPLLEQNLRYELGNFTTYKNITALGFIDASAEINGFYISVKNFEKAFWEKKLLAIKEAERVVESLDSSLSQIDKAEKLFTYLCKKTDYELYEDEDTSDTVHNYLYDSLITGKTHCDGFSNGYSLLLNTAGIECAEKHFSPPEDSDEVGHTWSVFTIDGKWYNADATADLLPTKNCDLKAGPYFAFGDELCQDDEDYDEVTPECVSYYAKVDSHLINPDADNFADAVLKAFTPRSPKWALVTVKGPINDKVLSDWIQRTANRSNRHISYIKFNLRNGDTAVLATEYKLFG